ncbi:MAG: sialate O-acetylesterase [Ruminococcaceae bacterium]|nr:sialate O-acetylesterase [Oscillospiraceae bacterium]
MDVIIFLGQSNMQGQSERLSDCGVVSNAYEYKYLTDETVPLKNPVGESITYAMESGEDPTPDTDLLQWLGKHALGAACYGNTNLVPSFCRTYTEITKRQVLAVHAAKGSTKISEWSPGSPIYQVLVQKSRGAIQKVTPERIFFVWLQGESNALASTTREQYKEALRTLCDGLKSDLGIDRFGIIRVGRFTNDDRDLEIIAAQDEICREDADFVMLTEIATELNRQPEYMNPHVRGHYSAKGLEALGSSAAKGLCKAMK